MAKNEIYRWRTKGLRRSYDEMLERDERRRRSRLKRCRPDEGLEFWVGPAEPEPGTSSAKVRRLVSHPETNTDAAVRASLQRISAEWQESALPKSARYPHEKQMLAKAWVVAVDGETNEEVALPLPMEIWIARKGKSGYYSALLTNNGWPIDGDPDSLGDIGPTGDGGGPSQSDPSLGREAAGGRDHANRSAENSKSWDSALRRAGILP